VKRPPSHPSQPSKQQILAFIGEQSGRVGTREIARAFGLKNADRAELKRTLRELADEGRVAQRRKKLHHPGTLPQVVLADIGSPRRRRRADRRSDRMGRGGAWAPAQDPHPRAGPRAARRGRGRRRPRPVAGRGDRRGRRSDPPQRPRHQDHRPGQAARARHLPRAAERRRRLAPIDKKQLGRELAIPPGAGADAQDGDLVAVEVAPRRGGFGLATARVTEKLGSLKSERAVSLIAINAHGIPNVFPAAALREAEAAQPAGLRGREDWREVAFVTIDPPDAKDHDDAVHAAPDTDPRNPGGHVDQHRHRGCRPLRAAGLGARSRSAHARQFGVLPRSRGADAAERISNDLCSLRPDEDRAALAVRIVVGADGRKRSHRFHRVLMRIGRQAQLCASAGRDRRHADADTRWLVSPVLAPLYAAYEAVKRGARRARAARSRSAGAQDHPQARRYGRSRVTPARLEAHRLIEEFMILANVAAAEALERASVPLIYRVHDEPDPARVNALREFLKTVDISLPKGNELRAAKFNHILARVKGRDVEALVNEVVLRTQAQAEYAAENYGHYGLNLRRLRPFHLADPPLRRSGRAPRPRPRRQARRRRARRHGGYAKRWARSRPRSRSPSGAP